MTTGRINQVATNSCNAGRAPRNVERTSTRVRIVCVEFRLRPCISFAIVLYHGSAPAPALTQLREVPPGKRALLHQRLRDSISARNTAELRYQMRVTCCLDGWKKATIDPYNSKTRAQVIQSRTSWHSMLKQKKKSEPGGSLVKHLLVVTQKRKPANRRGCTKQEEKKQFLKM